MEIDSSNISIIKNEKSLQKLKQKKIVNLTKIKTPLTLCNKHRLFKTKICVFAIFINYISIIIIFNFKNNALTNEKNKRLIEGNITNNLFNKGFLNINTIHKSKFNYYNFTSNINVYKDLYEDIEYIPINNSNYILESKQLSKEEYSKICEDGVLLDKTKYKRNNNPKISVVIPYYNKGFNTLNMLLRSIQNQSFKDIEIIFVDDGSNEDKIKDILEVMKEENRIILLRHKESKSTLLTRVDGVRYASGEYIIQIDQDDMYLNNLLFEKLYNKSKELDVDIIQFIHFSNDDPKYFKLESVPITKNVLIKQPELKTAFLLKGSNNRLYYCVTRMIWNKFVRRTTYLEAIEDLGDEYMNHKFRLYEDTIMMFELSQVAYSYYYYDLEGYRHCTFNSGKTKNNDTTIEKEILAKDQLLFIKLLLYKIDPKYDRYHIYRELGFGQCENDVKYLNKNEFDLGLQVVEAVFELERVYKNTAPELIACIKKIKKYFEV